MWIHNGFKDISMFCCQPEVWIKEPTRRSEWTSLAAAFQSRACTLSHLVSEPRAGASSPRKERCGEANALGNSGKEKELWHPTRLKRKGAKNRVGKWARSHPEPRKQAPNQRHGKAPRSIPHPGAPFPLGERDPLAQVGEGRTADLYLKPKSVKEHHH